MARAGAHVTGRALRLREAEFATYTPLSILVASWNVAAAQPSYVAGVHPQRVCTRLTWGFRDHRRAAAGDLERWLTGPPESPDIIVVGLQEIVELEIKKNASAYLSSRVRTAAAVRSC